jgi:capsular polysaccharide biosynthesis protein
MNTPMENKEMSLDEVVALAQDWLKYILSKLWVIILFILLGAAIAYGYVKYYKVQYTATTTFVLNESSSPNSGMSAALLGIGGGMGSDGLFSGGNIIWLYTTDLMLKKTLFSTILMPDGSYKMIIEAMLTLDSTSKKIYNTNPDYKKITFTAADADSISNTTKNILIKELCGLLRYQYIKVTSLPKTDGVVQVDVKTPSPELSILIANSLVDIVNQFYIETKTGKIKLQVDGLKAKTDEFNVALNKDLRATASAVDATPYPNPNRQINQVQPKRIGIDVEIGTGIYGQLTQELQAAEIELQKATPLIKVVDQPNLPLPDDSPSLIKYILIFSGIGLFIALSFIVLSKLIKDVLKKTKLATPVNTAPDTSQ